MKVSTNNLKPSGYFDYSDIKKAIEEKRFEQRSFQANFHEIIDGIAKTGKTEDEKNELIKKYHIERIAALTQDDLWKKEPILTYYDKAGVLDGGHRVWAAKYLGETEIEAIIVQESELSEENKRTLWKKISEFNGNSEDALKDLNIKYCK